MTFSIWLVVVLAIICAGVAESKTKANFEREKADRAIAASCERETLKHLQQMQAARDQERAKGGATMAPAPTPAPVALPAPVAATAPAIAAPVVAATTAPVSTAPAVIVPRSTAAFLKQRGEVAFLPPEVPAPAVDPSAKKKRAPRKPKAVASAPAQAVAAANGVGDLSFRIDALQELCERDTGCEALLRELDEQEGSA